MNMHQWSPVSWNELPAAPELDAMDFSRMGILIRLTDAGEDRRQYDRFDPLQVALAGECFREFLRVGYAAFSLNPKTGETEGRIPAFDQQAAGYMLIPQTVAG